MADSVLAQLAAAHAHAAVYDDIVQDYMTAMHALRELQVRKAQLEREAGELRLESDMLLSSLEAARRSTAPAAELEAARAALAAAQAELVVAYRDKGEAADAKAKALEQLEMVRGNYALQTAELAGAREAEAKLREEARHLRETAAETGKELQTRLAEAQRAQTRAEALEDENRDLVQRLIELKDQEADRVNEMNRMREEMLGETRRQAAEIIAAARAQVAQEAGASGSGVLDASMRRLSLAGEGVGANALPAIVLRSVPRTHPGGCFGIAFDAKGTTVATCGADKLVRLWDAARCTETSVLRVR